MAVPQPSFPRWLRCSQLSQEGPPREAGGMAAVVRLQPCLPRNGCRVCIAAITLEDVAALQLAQPSLGKMAVKEPAQPGPGVTFRG